MSNPTAEDYRTAARVLRHLASKFMGLNWWQRWQYPHDEYMEAASLLELTADEMETPNDRQAS